MAQVLLDQKSNQLRLKRGLYKIAQKLLDADTSSNDTLTVSSRLRKRKKRKEDISIKTAEESVSPSDPSSQEGSCIDFDDSELCDDPVLRKTQSLERKLPTKKAKKKGFTCIFCGHVATSSERLKEHHSRHTDAKHLECEVCGKKFAWRYSFRIHMASHNEDNPNKCNICGKKYCSKSSVKNHMLRVHGNPQKDFKCDKCEKEYITKAELDRHMYNHTTEKPFICEFCGNSYRFKGALLVHYRIHSGEKPYKCGYCEKSFIHLSSAIGHRRRHTGEMPFQCKECGKLFRVKRALTSHMAVHSEQKKFKCDKCEKSFKSRSGYRVHLDFHLGIKRHKCKFCEKTFRAWCNMNKHMKRHLGEKPHKCEMCDKTFIEKQELKSHMKSHFDLAKKCDKVTDNQDTVLNTCNELLTTSDLNCSASDIGAPAQFNDPHPADEILSSHIDITDNQAVMYDCNLSNSIDKCSDKCQLLPDSYVSQFLYPQHSNMQYGSQPVPVLNMYADTGAMQNRSGCMSNLNSSNYNCISLNNQNYGGFSYNLPNSDEILSKCKLCRSLFHSTMVLRSHLIDYHRIEEENVDDFLN